MMDRKSLNEAITLWIASAGGAGLLPKMPGTWGTAITLPVVGWGYENFNGPEAFRLFLMTCLFVVCLTSALVLPKAQELWKEPDPPRFVLDEVAGFLMVPIVTGKSISLPVLLTLGFALFRLFDILKPAGIRRIDKTTGFFGVMGDDILSGTYAGLILLIIARVI